MGSMDRIKRKSEELKKKRQNPNYQVDNTMININDKVNTIKNGGRLYDDIAPEKASKLQVNRKMKT